MIRGCIICDLNLLTLIRFGPRFPPMSKAYDPELIKTALNLANEMGMGHETHTGVYTCLGGPNYETVAELKMWKVLGVDAVGMSTVKPWRILRLHNLIANFFSIFRFTKSSQHVIAT